MATQQRVHFARRIVDSYTLNASELSLFVQYVEQHPTKLERELHDWASATFAVHFSACELTAVIRAVRYA